MAPITSFLSAEHSAGDGGAEAIQGYYASFGRSHSFGERETAQSVARCSEDGVRHRRSHLRDGMLAEPARAGAARHEVGLDGRRFLHPDDAEIERSRLLGAAVAKSDLAAPSGGRH